MCVRRGVWIEWKFLPGGALFDIIRRIDDTGHAGSYNRDRNDHHDVRIVHIHI